MRTYIRQIFGLFIIMFAALAGYLVYLIFFNAGIASNSYNRRMSSDDLNIIKGEIIANDGVTLAYNEDVYGGGYIRNYPFGDIFCHITGYSASGKSGIELKYNFALQKLHNEIVQRFDDVTSKTGLKADNLILTVDSELQKFVHGELIKTGYKGG